MSRFKKEEAKREKVYLKVSLEGPSGSGKTLSALMVAFGITKDWSKICLADTENRSALYYPGQTVKVTNSVGEISHCEIGRFQHIDFQPPYLPGDYVELIDSIAQDPAIEVLIIDSITHEWQACLELVERLSSGNKFQAWGKVTPLHNSFVEKMRLVEKHLIVTARSKQEYSMDRDDKGRSEVKKLGMKAEQREGLGYEFGVVFAIDMNHRATADKDRTNLFNTVAPFQLTPAIGHRLITWANEG